MLRRIMGFFALCALLAACALTGEVAQGDAAASPASGIVGRARAIDGDTIEIEGRLLDLHGIRIPAASCAAADGSRQVIPQQATRMLGALLDSHRISCVVMPTTGGRAGCRFADADEPQELNGSMIWNGWALQEVPVPNDARLRPLYAAQRRAYETYEAQARQARRGMWALTCNPPLRE